MRAGACSKRERARAPSEIARRVRTHAHRDHRSIQMYITHRKSIDSKLGCEVDATKPAWRFDAIEVRSLDSEAWMLDRCDEAGVEV